MTDQLHISSTCGIIYRISRLVRRCTW